MRIGDKPRSVCDLEVGMVLQGRSSDNNWIVMIDEIRTDGLIASCHWLHGGEHDMRYLKIQHLPNYMHYWTLIDHVEPCSLSEQAPVTRKRHLIERRG